MRLISLISECGVLFAGYESLTCSFDRAIVIAYKDEGTICLEERVG